MASLEFSSLLAFALATARVTAVAKAESLLLAEAQATWAEWLASFSLCGTRPPLFGDGR